MILAHLNTRILHLRPGIMEDHEDFQTSGLAGD